MAGIGKGVGGRLVIGCLGLQGSIMGLGGLWKGWVLSYLQAGGRSTLIGVLVGVDHDIGLLVEGNCCCDLHFANCVHLPKLFHWLEGVD